MLIRIGNKIINPEFIVHGEETMATVYTGIQQVEKHRLSITMTSGYWSEEGVISDELSLWGDDVEKFYSVCPMEFPEPPYPPLTPLPLNVEPLKIDVGV